MNLAFFLGMENEPERVSTEFAGKNEFGNEQFYVLVDGVPEDFLWYDGGHNA